MARRGKKSKSKKRKKRARASAKEAVAEAAPSADATASAADDPSESEGALDPPGDGATPEPVDLDAVTGEDAESTELEVIDLDAGPGKTAETEEVEVFDLDAGFDEDAEPAAAEVFDLDAGLDEDAEPAATEVFDLDAGVEEGVEPEEAEDMAAEDSTTEPLPSADPESEEPADGHEAERDGAAASASTPEARAKLLAEALAHAEMQEARYRVPTEDRRASRIKGVLALTVFTVAGILSIAPPAWVSPDPPSGLSSTDLRGGLAASMLLQAQQIEAFRVTSGRLPGSLDEVGAVVTDLRYVRSGGRQYQLVGYTPDGQTLVFDSSNPTDEFVGTPRPWRVDAGS